MQIEFPKIELRNGTVLDISSYDSVLAAAQELIDGFPPVLDLHDKTSLIALFTVYHKANAAGTGLDSAIQTFMLMVWAWDQQRKWKQGVV